MVPMPSDLNSPVVSFLGSAVAGTGIPNTPESIVICCRTSLTGYVYDVAAELAASSRPTSGPTVVGDVGASSGESSGLATWKPSRLAASQSARSALVTTSAPTTTAAA